MVGTELKLSTAGKLRQLREFSREQGPPATAVALVTVVIAIARAVVIQALIFPSQAWTT
jgi:hypothetical protein